MGSLSAAETHLAERGLAVHSFAVSIRTRKREGIDAAQGQGTKFGRSKTPIKEAFKEAYRE